MCFRCQKGKYHSADFVKNDLGQLLTVQLRLYSFTKVLSLHIQVAPRSV